MGMTHFLRVKILRLLISRKKNIEALENTIKWSGGRVIKLLDVLCAIAPRNARGIYLKTNESAE